MLTSVHIQSPQTSKQKSVKCTCHLLPLHLVGHEEESLGNIKRAKVAPAVSNPFDVVARA